MKQPFFRFYTGDYLADTMGLSCCEHGVYMLLLANSWKRGPLPDDLDHLQRLAANPPVEALRYILETYWTRTERGWINERLERERRQLEKARQKRVEAGRSGGVAKASNAKAMLEQCSSIAIAVPERIYPQLTDAEQTRLQKSDCSAEQRQKPSNARAMLQQCSSKPEARSSSSSQPSAERAEVDTSTRTARVPYHDIIGLWRKTLPELTAHQDPEHWTDARRAQIRARWQNELPDLDAWRECFEHVRKSDFLMGRKKGKTFRADLFWVTKPENLLRLYEGKYDG